MNDWSRGDQWLRSALLQEAFANVFARQSRLFPVLVIAVLLGIGLTGFRAAEHSALAQQTAALAADGQGIVLIQGSDRENPSSINRSSCEALSQLPGVLAAGVLLDLGRSDFAQLGSSVPVYAASSTLVSELQRVDAFVGSELIEGESGAEFLLTTSDHTLVSAVGDRYPAGIPINGSVVVGIDPLKSSADHCVVSLDSRQSANSDSAALAAQLEVTEHPVVAAPIASQTLDPYAQFVSRPTIFLPTVIGILIGLILALTVKLRSSELAAYRMSGSDRRSIVRLLSYEAMIVAGIYWVSGVSAALLPFDSTSPLLTLTLLLDHLSAATIAVAVSCCAAVGFSRQSVMEQAKDR